MEKVRDKIDYITRETDEVLYYDHEEFKKAVSYDQGFDDRIKKGIKQNKKENDLKLKLLISR